MSENQLTNSEKISATPNARPLRRIALWVGGIVLVAVLAIGLVLVTMVGRTVEVSPWLAARLSKQLSSALPGAAVGFEGVSVTVGADYHPSFVFDRLDITPETGGSPVSLAQVSTSLDYTKLLQGSVLPRDVHVSGLFLNARRESEGEIVLSVENTEAAQGGRSTSLGDLERDIDRMLTTGTFADLETIEIDAITIQFDDLRAQKSWTVDGGRFSLSRDGDDLRMSTALALLGGRDYFSTVEFLYETKLGQPDAQLGVSFQDVPSVDIATQSAALTWLNLIDAPISGSLRFEVDQDGNLGPLNAALRIGQGVLQPDGAVRPVPFQSASAHFAYAPDSDVISFTELSVDSAWGRASAEGEAHLKDLVGGIPLELWGQLKFTEFSGNPAGLFGQDVSLDHAQADFKLRFAPFNVKVGEFLLQSDGQTVVGKGDFSILEDRWGVSLNAHVDQIPVQDVVAWWPENAKPKTRKWIDENLLGATLSDVNFALRSTEADRPEVYLDFDYSDADIRYSKTLPVVSDASGRAIMMNNRFVAQADRAVIVPPQGGKIDVSGTSFIIPDTRIRQGPAEVRVVASSTVTALLSYLNEEPLEVLRRSALPVDLADGRIDVTGQLGLLLKKGLKTDEIPYAFTGIGQGVRSAQLMPGSQLVANRLDVNVTPERLRIDAIGRLGAVPFAGGWSMDLGQEGPTKSRLVAEIELSEQTVDELNLGLSREMVSGVGKADVVIDFEQGKRPELTATSDLTGIDLRLGAIGWRKPASRAGQLEVKATLGPVVEVTRLALAGPGLEALGAIDLKADGSFDRLVLGKLRISNWFDGTAVLRGRKGKATPAVEVTGGRLDLRNLPDFAQASGGQTTPISASRLSVQVSDALRLTDFSGAFTAGGGFKGDFSGLVNGSAAISGSLIPSGARNTIKIAATDAGGVFKSLEFLKNGRGGEMQLVLTPVGQESYDGVLEVTNLRVTDAPAIAELLNAISVVGLISQMEGEGILFSNVDAIFRLSPDKITITQGSAVGPSMGISADGVYDFKQRQMDLQGVISPIYVLNAIGRPIARKGEGLFGFNYAVRGAPDNLRTTVNPLSVLTPGILRDILRRPAPKLESAQ